MKHKKSRLFLLFSLITAFIFINSIQNPASGQVQPIKEVEKKLDQISEVEKAVLEDLFTLSQEIDGLELKEAVLNHQLETLQSEMEALLESLDENQRTFYLQLDVLKKILVNYQKKGPATYLESFLTAKDLTTFLKSLNILKDLSKNTNELLLSLTDGKKQLEAEKEVISAKEQMVKETMNQLQAAKAEMLALMEEQEKILVSLSDQRDVYEEELRYIENMWSEIKELFKNIVSHFNAIIQRGNLPVDKLQLQLVFPKIKGTLTDQVLNDVLKEQPDIPGMYFYFHPDYIDVEVPEKKLYLKCHFEIEENSSITFIIDEGSFYGMPLAESSIKELLDNGTLRLDFKELLGYVIVESAETFEGYMNFVIAPLLPDD